MEGRVGRQKCLVDIGVEALDNDNFVRGLARQIIPFVHGVILDAGSGALAIGINETS